MEFCDQVFSLQRRLEEKGWTDSKQIAVNFSRGGMSQVLSYGWDDKDDGHSLELCRDILDWYSECVWGE